MKDYTTDDVGSFLLQWYESNLSINMFCEKPFPLPRATFQGHVKNSGLGDMRNKGVLVKDGVQLVVAKYVKTFKKKNTC